MGGSEKINHIKDSGRDFPCRKADGHEKIKVGGGWSLGGGAGDLCRHRCIPGSYTATRRATSRGVTGGVSHHRSVGGTGGGVFTTA